MRSIGQFSDQHVIGTNSKAVKARPLPAKTDHSCNHQSWVRTRVIRWYCKPIYVVPFTCPKSSRNLQTCIDCRKCVRRSFVGDLKCLHSFDASSELFSKRRKGKITLKNICYEMVFFRSVVKLFILFLQDEGRNVLATFYPLPTV